MEIFAILIDFILHVDVHLANFVQAYGFWVYALLFAIIFAETGLVVMPFLPGDSLLFVVGALCGAGLMSLPIAMTLLIAAAILGNQTNYAVGSYFGPRVFQWENSRWFNKRAFEQAHGFYEKYGGVTLVAGRFMPFVRTFAPFVAGVAQMNRQDLAGFSSETEPSNYGLLGPPGWFSGPLGQPHPDYFSLLLFKQLVGQRVLSSAFSAAANLSTVWDSHVFCAASGGGAVALTFFNMAGDALVLTVPQLAAAQAPREEFILTSSATPEAPLSGGVSDWPASLTADAIFLKNSSTPKL
jgi:membrane-associated protein